MDTEDHRDLSMPATSRRAVLLGGSVWLAAGTASAQQPAEPALRPGAIDRNRVFQRDTSSGNPPGFSTRYDKGWGQVEIALTATSAVPNAALKLRLRDSRNPGTYASPGVVVQDWIPVPGAAALAKGANTLAFDLPAAPIFYLLDLASADDLAGGITVANPFGVGSVTAFAGQSIAVGFVNAYAYDGNIFPNLTAMAPPPEGGVIYAPFQSGVGVPKEPGTGEWTRPGNPGQSLYVSTWACEYLRLVVGHLGVVCALVGFAQTGSSIEQWRPYGPNFLSWAVELVMVHAGWKFEHFIWCLGSTDAGLGMRRETYRMHLLGILGALEAKMRAANGPRARPFVATLSPIPGFLGHDDPDRTYNAIQLACVDIAASRPNTAAIATLDAWNYFSGHPTMLSRVHAARDYYRAFMGQLGPARGGFPDARPGPQLVGTAVRAAGSRVIRVAVKQNGGTALVGITEAEADQRSTAFRPATASTSAELEGLFRVYPAGAVDAGQAMALDPAHGIELHGPGEIWMTLARQPPDNASFDIWYATDAGSQTFANIRDNVLDKDGIPYGRELQPYRAAVFAPAPVPDSPAPPTITSFPGRQDGNGVCGIVVTAGGDGYMGQHYNSVAPAVSLQGGGGNGARAVASLAGQALGSVKVVEAGQGYTRPPAVVLTNIVKLGEGARARALLYPPVAAAGCLIPLTGGGKGLPPAEIELSVDGGPFQRPRELVIRNDASWTATIEAPAEGEHTLAARRSGGQPGAAVRFATAAPARALPVAGAVAAFDASQVGLMWQDAACTIPAADLAPVRYMADALGTASNDVVNASADDRAVPFLEFGAQNRLPALNLNAIGGGGRSLTSRGIPALARLQDRDFTVLTVFRASQGNRGNEAAWCLGREEGAREGLTWMQVGDDYVINPHAIRLRAGVPAPVAVTSGTQLYSTLLRTVARFEAATGLMRFQVFGRDEGAAAVPGGSGLPWDRVAIGYGLHSGPDNRRQFLEGRFYEAVFFDRLLSDAERDALMDYATVKWGTG